MSATKNKLPLALRILHWVIIINFVLGIVYSMNQIFIVLAPDGGGVRPLGKLVMNADTDKLVLRRLYALECWLEMGGLCLYLAVTVYLPRLLQIRQEPQR